MGNNHTEIEKLEITHPVRILFEEHKIITEFTEKLVKTAETIGENGIIDEQDLILLEHLIEHFKEAEKHYLREENALFPIIEKHGLVGPPKSMWIEHDMIRDIKKGLYELVEKHEIFSVNEFAEKLLSKSEELLEMVNSHFYKENNILFPAALRLIADEEFRIIKKDFDEIGYCCFTPKEAAEAVEESATAEIKDGVVEFETGNLTVKELEALLNSLPVDITFVDKNDEVRYFSNTPERIFVRTRAVIGRKVQNCHPEKSVHVVNRILEEFKKGTRNEASFWINLNDRLILIRYFPVRDSNGEYLGCLEVTQDITDIKKIEGEKRLLDWS